MRYRRQSPILALAAVTTIIAACGGSSQHAPAPAKTGASAASGATSSTSAGQATGALSAEAQSGATGDIPDAQVFLTLTNSTAGYSMKYPEGWTRSGSAKDVILRDKNNLIHVVLSTGPHPTVADVQAELGRERSSTPSLKMKGATSIMLPAGPAVKATYTTVSAPNPVTGKRVTLTVDRYVLAHAGQRATVDLGTPVGVDNVDAYRMISRSFRWL